ncbi:hypothetical protein CLV62_104164 [Dysgonomonas alginatilytica]|uniref:DNA replication protein DnaC n=2 Tax=Dysgonomonas alginatilytica TaxID=1605892 RepID=A0A2V3PTF6_9BACT|nr:hypothetical protein CLV62_104164 [Dysgonomonas alginatilytica]
MVKVSDKTLSPEYTSQLRLLLSRIIKEQIPDFIYDQQNTEVIKNLFLYYTGQVGGYDLKKGIWLMGGNGTGKTTLLQIFSEFGKKRYDGFRIYDCAKVANDYAMNGELDVYTYNQTGYSRKPVNMAFDELGRETIPSNHFGQKLNVMQHILHIRYNLWRTEGIQTYITTNCDADETHRLYDNVNDRFISDRIKEMYNRIVLDGESRRK